MLNAGSQDRQQQQEEKDWIKYETLFRWVTSHAAVRAKLLKQFIWKPEFLYRSIYMIELFSYRECASVTVIAW